MQTLPGHGRVFSCAADEPVLQMRRGADVVFVVVHDLLEQRAVALIAPLLEPEHRVGAGRVRGAPAEAEMLGDVLDRKSVV